jgi:hypothetical protein
MKSIRGGVMSAARQMHQDERYKPSGCKVSLPENPTNQQLEQARQDLGLPRKPKYKVSAVKMRKFKERWANEPVAMAGEKV